MYVRQKVLAMLIAKTLRRAGGGGMCERDLCETTTSTDLATAISKQAAQASLPISLSWLAFMAAKCSSSDRQTVAYLLNIRILGPVAPLTGQYSRGGLN